MASDLAEVIARVKVDRQESERHGYAFTEVGFDDIDALLDAAEAAEKARDDALADAEDAARKLHRLDVVAAIRALRRTA